MCPSALQRPCHTNFRDYFKKSGEALTAAQSCAELSENGENREFSLNRHLVFASEHNGDALHPVRVKANQPEACV